MATSQQKVNEIVALEKEGYTQTKISQITGVASSTISDILRRNRENTESVEEKEGILEDMDDAVLEHLSKREEYSISNLAKRLRNAQVTANQLRKIHREDVDKGSKYDAMLEGVKDAVKRLNKENQHLPVPVPSPVFTAKRKETIMEILFSDLQIGKVGQYYNTEIAKKELKTYGETLVNLIKQKQDSLYKVEKIVFASLGDTVEDHLKHGVQSAVSTDSGLSEQISNAITYVWTYVLKPLAMFGIPIEFIGIAGNHGSSEHKGMDMYKAGKYSYDFVIYKSLELLCKESEYDHIEFKIPEGCFDFADIYGRYAIYEHGYFNSATEKSMEDQMKKRGRQIKKHVEYFRCGDMHHSCSYDNHKMVLNGAFFGTDTEGLEYSGVLGFNSIPSQIVMFHENERSIGKNTVKDYIAIQVAEDY